VAKEANDRSPTISSTEIKTEICPVLNNAANDPLPNEVELG